MKFLFVALFAFSFSASAQIVPPEIVRQLEMTGLNALVHGADAERGLYVFTYNVPGDFFKRYEFSLLATTMAQKELVKTFNRGDRIFVQGRLGSQPTPQPHVYATEIKLLEKYNPGIESPAGSHQKVTKLPDDLRDKTDFVGQVHAVIGNGLVLVMEYKEVIIPLVVNEPVYTRELFRGDVIRVAFTLQTAPGRPTHIILKSAQEAGGTPVQVLERLVDRHDKIKTLEGRLVLFPKSPTINRDVWAIEEDLGYGLARYSTLVNFTEVGGGFPELEKIDQKMRALWDSDRQAVFHGRNKFIHTKVRIRATGKMTVFTPNQANAQINLTAAQIIPVQ
ncbi:MAG: hypothetical protein AB7F59_07670 [Bdellovibrionales bacterium]